jgi:hypothetical protein
VALVKSIKHDPTTPKYTSKRNESICTHRKICILMFIAALFLTAKRGNTHQRMEEYKQTCLVNGLLFSNKKGTPTQCHEDEH